MSDLAASEVDSRAVGIKMGRLLDGGRCLRPVDGAIEHAPFV